MIGDNHSGSRFKVVRELVRKLRTEVHFRCQRVGIHCFAFDGYAHPSSLFTSGSEPARFSSGSFKHRENMVAEKCTPGYATAANLHGRAADRITVAINVHRKVRGGK